MGGGRDPQEKIDGLSSQGQESCSEKKKDYILMGLGNIWRGDDGVGCFITQNFKSDDWLVLDCGTVPENFREASYALGATKWQTVKGVVLPTALPGILTGTILGVGRAAGETAPILFTAVTFYTRRLPSSIFDEVMALPYHIYALMTEGTKPEFQDPIAYGTALVLLLLVLGINLIAIIIRYRARRVKKW